MRKIICPYTKKGIWMTREVLDQIRTMDLLRVPITITAIPVDFNTRSSSFITLGNKLIHGHYFDNNQWGFIVTENFSMIPGNGRKPDWLSHPLFPDWANGHGVHL